MAVTEARADESGPTHCGSSVMGEARRTAAATTQPLNPGEAPRASGRAGNGSWPPARYCARDGDPKKTSRPLSRSEIRCLSNSADSASSVVRDPDVPRGLSCSGVRGATSWTPPPGARDGQRRHVICQ